MLSISWSVSELFFVGQLLSATCLLISYVFHASVTSSHIAFVHIFKYYACEFTNKILFTNGLTFLYLGEIRELFSLASSCPFAYCKLPHPSLLSTIKDNLKKKITQIYKGDNFTTFIS